MRLIRFVAICRYRTVFPRREHSSRVLKWYASPCRYGSLRKFRGKSACSRGSRVSNDELSQWNNGMKGMKLIAKHRGWIYRLASCLWVKISICLIAIRWKNCPRLYWTDLPRKSSGNPPVWASTRYVRKGRDKLIWDGQTGSFILVYPGYCSS
jgi:hypothetical protein